MSDDRRDRASDTGVVEEYVGLAEKLLRFRRIGRALRKPRSRPRPARARHCWRVRAGLRRALVAAIDDQHARASSFRNRRAVASPMFPDPPVVALDLLASRIKAPPHGRRAAYSARSCGGLSLFVSPAGGEVMQIGLVGLGRMGGNIAAGNSCATVTRSSADPIPGPWEAR